ncbi:MAG TPA: hypothetical protein VIO60_08230 [Rectinemataceae bacterium]
MSQSLDRRQVFPPVFQDLSKGLVAGVLYLSYLLSFAYLIPLQTAFTGRGLRSGWIASLAAALTIVVGSGIRLAGLGGFAISSLAASSAPPLLLLVALGLINAKPGRIGRAGRIVLVAGLLSAAVSPFVFRIIMNPAFRQAMASFAEATLTASGMELSRGKAVDEAVGSALRIIGSGFAPMILGMLGFSWWMGSNLALRSRFLPIEEEERIARIKAISLWRFRVPQSALWPSLASWAFLFAVLVGKGGPVLSAVAWNIALFFACPYAVQGLGILGFVQEAYPAARFLRLLGPLAVILLALSPAVGTIIIIGLPLLGITEVWIPYRTIKGASK